MDSPFRGLVPYSDSPEDVRMFFGRDTERRVLMDNLTTARLSVVYGESGVGKSSLLNAGVAARLRADPESIVIMYRTWYIDPVVGLIEAIRAAAGEHANEIPAGNLTKALEALVKVSNRRVLVILDQFEEYFQYQLGAPDPSSFAVQFPAAVQASALDANFIISIRSDSLALLDFFKGRIPNLFANRIPVRNLTVEGAREAVECPLGEYNKDAPAERRVTLEPGNILSKKIVEQIGRKPEDAQEPDAVEVPATYLQLVLTRLWEQETQSKSNVLRASTLASLGGGARIYQQYFSATVTRELDWRERRLATTLFRYLITPTGRKITTSDKELSLYEDLKGKDVRPILRKLERARILVTVPPPPGDPAATQSQGAPVYYQFAHDVLARAALQWRGTEVESRRGNRRLAVGGLIAAVVVIAIIVSLLGNADTARKEAVVAQQAAQTEREEYAAAEFKVRQIQRSVAAEPMPPKPAENGFPAGEVHGIDVSKFTPSIDWGKLKTSRTSFAFVRATQGTNLVDNRFRQLWQAAQAAGIRRGAYHVYRSNQSPVEQADFFLRTVGSLDPADLAPAIDLSSYLAPGGSDPGVEAFSRDVLSWLQRVESAVQRKPLIYGATRWIEERLAGNALHAYPVWIAQYGPKCQAPAGWKRWTFWQYTASGKVDGVAGIADLNKFNGTAEDFERFR
jgi:GH25 family lysozyme M1 (1,4-beta-N-acetylmuramidase)